jgi:hypothetical protein
LGNLFTPDLSFFFQFLHELFLFFVTATMLWYSHQFQIMFYWSYVTPYYAVSLYKPISFYLRAPQQMLRTHHSLDGLLCKPVRKMMKFFFCFFILMEHLWNEIDRGKPKYSERTLSQCHFVHHKSHKDWPGIKPGPPRWEAGD